MFTRMPGFRRQQPPADVYETIINTNRHQPEVAAQQLATICRRKDALVEKILREVAANATNRTA